MLKSVSVIFFNIFIVFLGHSQINIQGVVNDELGKPVEFATIALISSVDSTLVKGVLTNEKGSYVIDKVITGKYRIMTSYLGYESVYTDPFVLSDENKLATIDINLLTKGVLLKEAVIEGKRPFLEQKADRLVVNVANSAVAAGATALEILQKVPGVIILQDRVTIGGNRSAQVWVDGKPSPYQDINAALRDMPGDQIEKIELITQPGAQFDASGGPILNIVLKRNIDLGMKTTAALTLAGMAYDQDDVNAGNKNYHRVNPSVNITYRKGKFNTFANLSHNQGDFFSVFLSDRLIGKESYLGQNFDNQKYTFQNFRVGGDYYISDKTTISAVGRLWDRNGDGGSFSITDVFNQNFTKTNSFITENAVNSNRNGKYANASIKHEFDKKSGQAITFDLDYNQFNTQNINDLSIYTNAASSYRSISQQKVDQPVNIWVGKLDYKLPLDSIVTIETGLKSSIATVDNQLRFSRGGQLSVGESNDFLYYENINAAYVNFSKKLKKMDLTGGLRVEQTIIEGTSMENTVLSRNYTQLFPSAGIIYNLSSSLAVQSSYSKRVNRPNFQQQNPFSFFIDSLTYTRGNPSLRPEIIHTSQLNLTFDGQPFIGVSYSSTNDVIIENAPKIEGTKTFTTVENLAQNRNLALQLNFPIKIGKRIDGFGGNQAVRNSYNAVYEGIQYNQSRWNWLAYWQLNASLFSDIKLEIGGFYMTKFLEEFLVIDNMSSVNIGLSKSFADKKGRVSLSLSDAFYGQKTKAVIDFNDVRVSFLQRNLSRNLRVTTSYQFGNTKMKNNSNRTSASQEESSRIKIE
jgi:hypothetical protein